MDQTEQTGIPGSIGEPVLSGQAGPGSQPIVSPSGMPGQNGERGQTGEAEQNEVQPALVIRGVSKHFGSRRILSGINLEVYPGEIFGFLGPNGSGKTTTIKLILGLLSMETGEILIDGHSVRSNFEAALARVGGIIENPEMYKYLTGYENLELYARMYTPHIPKARIDEVTRLVGLGGRIHDKVGRYSLGMRQRLGVAQALLASPRLLVLDEPTNGLDPVGIHDLRELLRHVARTEGTAVFISSHLLAEMDQMCDRVGILENGTVVGVHSVKELHNTAGEAETVKVKVKLHIATSDPDRVEAVIREMNGAAESRAAEENSAVPGGKACADGISAVLLDRAPDPDSEIAGSVFVTVVTDRADVRGLIRRLALSDAEFHAILPVRRSLEDAYLSMTRPLGGTGAGPDPAKKNPFPPGNPPESGGSAPEAPGAPTAFAGETKGATEGKKASSGKDGVAE